ncbi:MAG: hypothetical protein F4Y47_18055 [Acidobacteriia bacterium]|nr:hypothetical protein [Terriglobia bacterium]MYG02145.1 hypothetical protein [Terriglobia bacterium]MYK11024.1 hypothetical protein [Terriglobia bacterium]
MNNSPLAALAAVICLIALAGGFAGNAALLGMASVALIVVLCLLGLRSPGRPSRLTLAAVLAFGIGFCCLLALQFHLHDPTGPLKTIGGFPAGTALLVYGIAPLGLMLGVLYGLIFDREVLPPDRQRAFIERYSSKQ